MTEELDFKIKKFDGHDFGFWKMQIEDYLYHKGLHLPLLGQKPENTSDADWASLDRRALSVVRLSLTKNVGYNINIFDKNTTFGLLKALSNTYDKKPSASEKVFLMCQLKNTKMREGASVVTHVSEFSSVISRLSSADIKLDDEVQALLLLSSLPESWSEIVMIACVSAGTTKLTFEGVRDLILGEDIRRRSAEASSGSLSEGRGRKFERGNNRGGSKSRNRGQSKIRIDVVCWKCKEVGHFRNQCKALSHKDLS